MDPGGTWVSGGGGRAWQHDKPRGEAGTMVWNNSSLAASPPVTWEASRDWEKAEAPPREGLWRQAALSGRHGVQDRRQRASAETVRARGQEAKAAGPNSCQLHGESRVDAGTYANH